MNIQIPFFHCILIKKLLVNLKEISSLESMQKF